MSPKPKHEVSWLTTNVDMCLPLMSFRERTVYHLIKASRLDHCISNRQYKPLDL